VDACGIDALTDSRGKSWFCDPLGSHVVTGSPRSIGSHIVDTNSATVGGAAIPSPCYPSEEETVKRRSQNVKPCDADGNAGRDAFWPQNTNRRWIHMLSHRVAVICTIEFASAVARCCTMPDSRAASTEDRWKRFFSLLSHKAAVSGSDPMSFRASIVER
jgi:hypothetical protein